MNLSLRRAILVLTLLGLPLVLVDAALQYVCSLRHARLQRDEYVRLDAAMRRVQPLASSEGHLRRALRTLMARATRAADPVTWLDERLAVIERRFPRLLTPTLFDAQDRVVARTGANTPRRVAEKLLATMRDYYGYELPPDGWRRNWALFAPFFGTPRPWLRLIEGSGWLETSHRDDKTWFFYHLGSKFALFANVNRRGYPPMLGIQRWLAADRGDGVRFNLVDLDVVRVSGPGDAAWRANILRAAMRCEQEPGRHLHVLGRLTSVAGLDKRFRLFASCPDRTLAAAVAPLYAWRVLAVLLLMLAGVLASLPAPANLWALASIRTKLLTLMLVAVGLPLGVLSATAKIHLVERERTLIDQIGETARQRLRDLDARLPNAQRQCETFLRRALADIHLELPGDLERLRARMDQFKRQHGCRSVIVIDGYGNHVPVASMTLLPAMAIIVKPLMQGFLREIGGEVGGGLDQRLIQAEAALAGVSGRTIPETMDELVGRLGTIIPQFVGPVSGYTYWGVLRSRAGVPTHAVLVTWDTPNFLSDYLHRMLGGKPLDDGTELMSINCRPSWAHLGGGRKPSRTALSAICTYLYFPARPMSPSLAQFVRSSIRRQQPDSAIVEYKDGRWLVAVMPGAQLQGFLVLSLTPLTGVVAEIADVRQRLVFFGTLCLVFTVVLAMLLAHTFLRPIALLAGGMDAVRRGDWTQRVPVESPDELGVLTGLFNRMTDSLEELSIGRQVQTQLFPSAPLEFAGYRVYGRSRPATELGGDYFDYHVTAGGFIQVLLGDVTGHGIPAALVMAMAKAVVGMAQAQSLTGEQMVQQLNALIHGYFKAQEERRFMTLGLCTVDPRAHELVLYNFGHTTPMRCGPTFEFVPLAANGWPIGVTPRLKMTPTRVSLAPGERVLYYTDGLVESLAIARDADGFDVFRGYAAARPRLDLVAACHDLLEQHPAVLSGNPLPDDFTVVMIERVC